MEIDIVYFLLLLFLFYFSYLEWNNRSQVYFKCAAILFFVFVAFRAPCVGADTYHYIRYLTGVKNYYSSVDSRELEPLFIVYREIISSLTSSRFIVMVVNSLIILSPLYYITKHYSYKGALTILLFFVFYYYYEYLVVLRQNMGFAVLLCGTLFLLESKRNKIVRVLVFLLFALIGYFIHTMMVVYGSLFLLLWLIPLKSKKIYYIIIATSLLLGVVIKNSLVETVLNMVYSSEIDAVERINGYLAGDLVDFKLIYKLFINSIFAVVVLYYIPKDRINHLFVKIFLAGIVINNFLFGLYEIHRIVSPMQMFGCIVVTWCFAILNNYSRIKRVAFLSFFLLVLFYNTQAVVKALDVSKYKRAQYYFIFEDYPEMVLSN